MNHYTGTFRKKIILIDMKALSRQLFTIIGSVMNQPRSYKVMEVNGLSLGSPNTGKVERLLKTVFEGTDHKLRVDALVKLRMLDGSDLSQQEKNALAALLKDPDSTIRSEAIMTLTFLFKEEILDLLLPSFTDSSSKVRSSLVAALGYIGVYNDRVRIFLTRCLCDQSDDIRDRTARALGNLGAREMIKELEELSLTDISNLVRVGAIVALTKLGHSSLAGELIEILHDEGTLLEIKHAIIDYLKQIDPTRVF